jgi:lysyl-tRNA synthetase class 2
MISQEGKTDNRWYLAKKMPILRRRAEIIALIRQFFSDQGYLEVETPCRIPAPAPEAHIDAFRSGDWYLQTSPELCMKRLLAAGYEKIYQICKCFREGERGSLHLPEFTMLEWYEVGGSCSSLMQNCETMIRSLASRLTLGHNISWNGMNIPVEPSWGKIAIKDAFALYSPLSLSDALHYNRFDELLAIHIEPKLGWESPVFLTDYPAPLAALARIREDDLEWAERFELYIGGMEIANGFAELTDSREQKIRFQKENNLRNALGKAVYPLPGPFLDDLSVMPDCVGIALGLERLVMLFTGVSCIDDVVSYTPEML